MEIVENLFGKKHIQYAIVLKDFASVYIILELVD